MFLAGLFDFPTQKSVVDVEGGFATARRIAEQSIVLLKNKVVFYRSIAPPCTLLPSSARMLTPA